MGIEGIMTVQGQPQPKLLAKTYTAHAIINRNDVTLDMYQLAFNAYVSAHQIHLPTLDLTDCIVGKY